MLRNLLLSDKYKRGSAAVEAALVYPAAILITAALIAKGFVLYSDVKDSSEEHISEFHEISENDM